MMSSHITHTFSPDHPLYSLVVGFREKEEEIVSLQETLQKLTLTVQEQYGRLQLQAQQIVQDHEAIQHQTQQTEQWKTTMNSLSTENLLYAGQVTQLQEQLKSLTVPARQQQINAIINMGLGFYAVPYQFGATYDTNGAFDSPSFARHVFAKNGIHLPQTVQSQAQVGSIVGFNEIMRGDLAFFGTDDDGNINHVGICFGNGLMLHVVKLGGVCLSKIDDVWKKRFVTARRILV